MVKNKKIIFLLSYYFFFYGSIAYSKIIVRSTQGNSFVQSRSGTQELKVGNEISDFSEIFTENKSQLELVINDYFKIILASKSQVKIMNKIIELQKGHLWYSQYLNRESNRDREVIHTANGMIETKNSTGIVSFYVDEGRTQLIVLEDIGTLVNLFQQEAHVEVNSGEFSFLEKASGKQKPRQSTPLGQASYQKIAKLFIDGDKLLVMDLMKKEALENPKIVRIEEEDKEHTKEKNQEQMDENGNGKILKIIKQKKSIFNLSQFLDQEVSEKREKREKYLAKKRKEMLYGKVKYSVVIFKSKEHSYQKNAKQDTNNNTIWQKEQKLEEKKAGARWFKRPLRPVSSIGENQLGSDEKKNIPSHIPRAPIEEVIDLLQELKQVQTL
jgi:hypothetical protein